MDNLEERNEYNAIYRKEVTLYESTPPWRVFARTRRMGHVRRAAANLAYAGGSPNIPRPARADFVSAVGRSWKWVRDCVILDWPGFCLFWLGVIVAVVFGVIQLVGWIGTWGGPPKPLPSGITQSGFQFLIPAGYVESAEYEEVANPVNLCERIPGYNNTYDDYTLKTRADGVIVVTCDPGEDEDDD